MKKKEDAKGKGKDNKKLGKPSSEYLPSSIKNIPREQLSIKQPETINRKFTPLIEPFQVFEEWPGDEEARNSDFGLDSDVKFVDSFNWDIKLPTSLNSDTMGEIKWLRPNDYVREFYLEKEIKLRLPQKNHIKIRKKINEYYSKHIHFAKQLENVKNFEDQKKNYLRRLSFKRTATYGNSAPDEYDEYVQMEIVKDFQRIYEMTFDFRVVRTFEREETEEEISRRKIEYENKLKEKSSASPVKGDKKALNQNKAKEVEAVFNSNPMKVKDFLPSNISMSERYPKYSKWISSIFQIIKDMNIRDVNTGEAIYSKIYPQKDGSPIYNPHGKYWVKLFFMGKYRKVEIDDTMPCGKYDEFLMPKCEILEELWPALICKALLKLFTYKFRNRNFIYEEIGDPSIMYALTGYIGEKILVDVKKAENLGYKANSTLECGFFQEQDTSSIQIISNILSEDFFEPTQKYIIGFNSSIPMDDSRFGFNKGEVNEESIVHHLNMLNHKSPLRKKQSLVDVHMNKNKINKNVNSMALKGLQNNTVTINSITSNEHNKERKEPSLFSKNSIENLEKVGRIDESMKMMLLKNISSIPNINTMLHRLSLSPPKMNFNRQTTSTDIFTKSTLQLFQIDLPPTNHHSSMMNVNSNNALVSPVKSHSRPSDMDLKHVSLNERINDQLYMDFAYSIIELFYSNNFNMKRVKPVDFSDLRKKIQDAKVSYKQLSKEQKKTYIQNLKDLKIKQKEEKQKRLEDLKKPGNPFYLIKIKSDAYDRRAVQLNFDLIYDSGEIEMAKKCMLNNWIYPPPSFFESTFVNENMLDTSSLSDQKHNKGGDLISVWTKDFYLNQILNNEVACYDVSDKEPVKKPNGYWMDMKDFANLFKYFIVLHNPKFYPFTISVDNIWYNFSHDIYMPKNDYNVFYLSPNSQRNLTTNINNNKTDNSRSCFMIVFEPNTNNWKIEEYSRDRDNFMDVIYYLNFELYDISGKLILTKETINLTHLFSVFQFDDLDPLFEYYLILRGSIVPFGYYMKILSDHCIENMSYETYLKKAKGYSGNTFNFTYPALEENNFYIIGRMKCILTDEIIENVSVIFTANKFEDKYFKQFIEIYVIHCNNEKIRIYFDKEFLLSSLCKYKDQEVTFLICTRPPFSVSESNLEIEILSSVSGLKFEQIETLDPFEVTDIVTSNKHGFVCIECIYVPMDAILYTSMEFSIFKLEGDLKENVRMKLEVIRGDKIIFTEDFFNNLVVHNLILDNSTKSLGGNIGSSANSSVYEDKSDKKAKIKSTKTGFANVNNTSDQNTPFYIYCYIDLSESSQQISNTFENGGFSWKLRVFSNESMVIIKNTQKEDNEKALKEGCEINEPGRFERAKKARAKYILQLRKDNGEELSPEDEIILNEKRVIKRTEKTESQPPVDLKGTKGKSTVNLKTTAANPKDLKDKNPITIDVQNELELQYKLNFDKDLPKPDNHKSNYLKDFLSYSYQSRIFTKKKIEDQFSEDEEDSKFRQNTTPICRNEEEIVSMKENINCTADSIQNKILREIDDKLDDKDQMKEKLAKNYQHVIKKRNNIKEKYLNELMNERNSLKEREIIGKSSTIHKTDI